MKTLHHVRLVRSFVIPTQKSRLKKKSRYLMHLFTAMSHADAASLRTGVE